MRRIIVWLLKNSLPLTETQKTMQAKIRLLKYGSKTRSGCSCDILCVVANLLRLPLFVIALIIPLAIVLHPHDSLAQEPMASPDTPQPEELTPEAQAALVRLRQYDGDAAGFQKVAKAARKAGVPQAVVDFLRLQFAIFNGDADLLQLAIDQAASTDSKLDELLGGRHHSQPFISLAKARLAEARGEHAKVKEAYMEAFWANPKESSLVANFAAQYQRDQLLANVTIPLDQPLRTSAGEKVTLKELMNGKKAVLIDFWASWCAPCLQLMPELKQMGEQLPSQGVAVVAMNVGEPAEKAEPVREKFGMTIPWLLDTPDQLYNNLIQNATFPHQLLVNQKGEILFDGHPHENDLMTALQQLGAEMAP